MSVAVNSPYSPENMLKNGEIKIIWKTKCKWRDTDYIVERKDVKPNSVSSNDDWRTVQLRKNDQVKVKYGTRW